MSIDHGRYATTWYPGLGLLGHIRTYKRKMMRILAASIVGYIEATLDCLQASPPPNNKARPIWSASQYT